MNNNIKFVVFDFDGVFTDGKCYFDKNNNILKYYNIKDGMALSILKKNNIITGLISSYSSEKNILLNGSDVDKEIINHFVFDYKYIGKCNKLDILNEWLKTLNINYNEVAYIGDDINDIEILKLVGFSACPNDAVKECKEIVNYVCSNTGGNGCVREFVDLVINIITGKKNFNNTIDVIQEIKKEVLYQLYNFDVNNISYITNIIQKCEGNIYITGIGKSANLAVHFSDLLKSISIKCYYLDATKGMHGDIGCITNSDVVIMFSKSGKTNELQILIPYLKHKKCNIIGICNDKNNNFIDLCDHTLILPLQNELTGEIDKIPTNSFMSHLLFCNIVVTKLKNNINLDQYKLNHPAGSIGNNLKKIKECLIYDFPKIVLSDKNNFVVNLHDVLLEMTRYKIGCCFFVNENNSFFGLLTDGDIRRILLVNENKKTISKHDVNINCYVEHNLEKYIKDCKKCSYIPIIIKEQLCGIIKN